MLEASGQRHRLFDGGKIGAARLLCRFVRDTPPALDAFACSLSEVLFCTPRDDGNNCCDAELSSLFDSPLHAIEFKDGEQQGDGQRCFNGDLFDEVEDHLFAAYGCRNTAKYVAI